MAQKVRAKGNIKGKGEKKSTVKAKCVCAGRGGASVRMGAGRRQINEDSCFF